MMNCFILYSHHSLSINGYSWKIWCDSIEQFKSYNQKFEIRCYFLPLAQTILEKSPWNTLGIFNSIKRVFLMLTKLFNIGYKKKAGPSTNAFPFPAPHHSMLQHFGDTLNAFARFNIARGSGGIHFPLKTLKCFKTFFEDCLSHSQKITSDFKLSVVTLKLLNRITPNFP